MRRRAQAAERTRGRILDAAHALLDRPGRATLTLQEVAEEAGVTRATVYLSVGTRAELLAAVFEQQGERIGYDRVRAAGAHPDLGEAVLATVREASRAWARAPRAIRNTLALAALDDEIGTLVARYEGYRKAEMAALAQRAYAGGAFREGVTAEHAAVVLGLLTSFTTFELLRAMGARAATDHLVQMARDALGISGRRKGKKR
jgi:AcrR family transcriptional regulator